MSEKTNYKPVLVGVLVVLFILRIVFFLSRLNKPEPVNQLQKLKDLTEHLQQEQDSRLLTDLVPQELPVPQKPVFAVNTFNNDKPIDMVSYNVYGPVKQFKEYALREDYSSGSEEIRVNGTTLTESYNMVFTHDGYLRKDNIDKEDYYFDNAGLLKYSGGSIYGESENIIHRYTYDEKRNLTRDISYLYRNDSVLTHELYEYKNTYKQDRIEIERLAYYDNKLISEDFLIYDLYGNLIYTKINFVGSQTVSEELKEYTTINGKRLITAVYVKGQYQPRTTTELYEYDNKGRLIKSFKGVYVTMADGIVCIRAYGQDNSYTEKEYKCARQQNVFDVGDNLQKISSVEVNADGKEIKRETIDIENERFITSELKYDSFGNCISQTDYIQDLDANQKPAGSKELYDMIVRRHVFYKAGEKNYGTVPVETKMEKEALNETLKQIKG